MLVSNIITEIIYKSNFYRMNSYNLSLFSTIPCIHSTKENSSMIYSRYYDDYEWRGHIKCVQMQNVWICIIYTAYQTYLPNQRSLKRLLTRYGSAFVLSEQIIKNCCCIYSEYLTHNTNILITNLLISKYLIILSIFYIYE